MYALQKQITTYKPNFHEYEHFIVVNIREISPIRGSAFLQYVHECLKCEVHHEIEN
jgi:hypothetical protein